MRRSSRCRCGRCWRRSGAAMSARCWWSRSRDAAAWWCRPMGSSPVCARPATRRERLLIADEIWTGLGRSGEMFASIAVGVVPDLICVGKGLGGGVPISACIGSKQAMQAWGAHGGETLHTGTHFGSPPACLAAVAVLDALDRSADRWRSGRATSAASWLNVIRASVPGPRRDRACAVAASWSASSSKGARGRALAVMQQAARRRVHRADRRASDGATLTLTPPLTITEPLLVAFRDGAGRSAADHPT